MEGSEKRRHLPETSEGLKSMRKLMTNPRIVLPGIGVIGLLLYVTAPCWLPNALVSRLDFVALGFAGIIA